MSNITPVNDLTTLKENLFDKLLDLQSLTDLDEKNYTITAPKNEYNALYTFMKSQGLESEYNEYADWKNYLAKQKELCDAADPNILYFIYSIMHAKHELPIEMQNLQLALRSGYNYYFAMMLKARFNFGEVYLPSPHSHFVWKDPNTDILYDASGVYIASFGCLISEDELREKRLFEDLLHNKEDICALEMLGKKHENQ